MMNRSFLLNGKKIVGVVCPVNLDDCQALNWCAQNGHSEYKEVFITNYPSKNAQQKICFKIRGSDKEKRIFSESVRAMCDKCQYRVK